MALTIRPTKDDEKNIEKLKKQLDEPRASQALLKAAEIVLTKYNSMEFELDQVTGKLKDVTQKHDYLMNLIKRKEELDKEIRNAITK